MLRVLAVAGAGAGASRMLGVSRVGCAMHGGCVGRAAAPSMMGASHMADARRCTFRRCGGCALPHPLRVRRVYAASPSADACGNLMDDRLDEEQMGEVLC